MIYKNSEQVELKFGKGDICVSTGYFIDDDNAKINMVAFNNHSPRDMGEVGDLKIGQEYEVDSFPVIMTFTKPESIDVVIEQLRQAKMDMMFD